MSARLKWNLIGAALFAALYVILFHISDLLVDNMAIGGIASLMFLPACIRLLGYLIIGLWIVPALFAAGCWLVFTGAYDFAPGLRTDLLITAFTAIGGPLGALVAARFCGLTADLDNLKPLSLFLLSFGCSAGNALFHHASLRMSGVVDGPSSATAAILIGDMLGTWAIIYLIKIASHPGLAFWRR